MNAYRKGFCAIRAFRKGLCATRALKTGFCPTRALKKDRVLRGPVEEESVLATKYNC